MEASCVCYAARGIFAGERERKRERHINIERGNKERKIDRRTDKDMELQWTKCDIFKQSDYYFFNGNNKTKIVKLVREEAK